MVKPCTDKIDIPLTTLNKIISEGRQSVSYQELLDYNGKRICIKIKSDSIRPQCYAKVEVYSTYTDNWNLLYSIPYSSMKTSDSLIYKKNFTFSMFEEDRTELLKLAIQVLGE